MAKVRPKTSAKRRVRRVRRQPAAAATKAIEATLAALAHDIRTPLTGILALGELLTTSELGERERGWAASVKDTAEHLAFLASLIVDAVRADAKGLVLRREVFQPRRVAQAIAASLAARGQIRDLNVEIEVADNLPDNVIGDRIRLRAAVENLIDNAVKFTERGRVRLDVGYEKAARGKGRLVFTVSDSGIGLSTAEIKRLFRPFSQANVDIARRFGGAGLGLAFVKRVARAMGGDLTVTSRPGGGSRFRFTATVEPVAAAGAAAGDAAANATSSMRSLSILCAEDNPYGRVLLNTILSELGHRADFVGSGAAAIETLSRGGYDLVLMDVTLPGVDGLEATRRIRELGGATAAIPIIGISGRAKADDEINARASGMDGYIAKPLSPRGLAQAISAVIGAASA